MEEYQLRVIEERNDLYIKIIKLKYWLSGCDEEEKWLDLQLRTMETYLDILDHRIKEFIIL